MDVDSQRGIGKSAGLAVAAALLVIAGLIAFAGTTKTPASISSNQSSPASRASQFTFFNSTVSLDGLQLGVALNTTSLPAGQGLSADVYLTNTLPRNISLPANLTAFGGDSTLESLGRGYQCDGAGLLGVLNFGVYRGHYTAENFSQEPAPLLMEAPVPGSCPNPYYYVQSQTQGFEFAPNSDMATLSGQKTTEMHLTLQSINFTAVPYTFCCETIIQNGSTTTSRSGMDLGGSWSPSEGARGYWTMPPNGTAIPSFGGSNILQTVNQVHDLYHEFGPGLYTIVAEDFWNQTAFAYFGVHPNSSSSTIACFETGFPSTISVRLVQDATLQPAQGVHVFAYELNPCGASNQVDLGVTNSTGYAPIQLNWNGKYTVEVDYNSQTIFGFSGQSFNLPTLDTLSVPSGIVTEQTNGCLPDACLPYTTTTTANITTALPGGP